MQGKTAHHSPLPALSHYGQSSEIARNCAASAGVLCRENGVADWVAEREGFEPSIRFWRILTFQASAFDHSATAPHALDERRALAGCA